MTDALETTPPAPRPFIRERVLLVVAISLALLAISSPLWFPAWNIVRTGFGDSYTLYRASLEKRHLEEFNRRLTSELIALRTRHSHRVPLEQELEAKLSALEEVVENATSLGFLKRGRDSDGQIFAHQQEGSRAATGPLAALMKDPVLVKKSSGRSKERGVGGAEVPCKDATCAFGAHKKEISLYTGDSVGQESSRTTALIPEHRRQLLQRFELAMHAMRILPIGSPANGEISSEYGRRRSPFSGRASFHEGIDLSLNKGGRVVATGAGTVLRVAYNGTYGLVVDVEHAPGLVTRYAHLTKAVVRPGQSVERGDLLALSGSTGRSTGPHLHYEILYRGKPKNPRSFIELADELRSLGLSDL